MFDTKFIVPQTRASNQSEKWPVLFFSFLCSLAGRQTEQLKGWGRELRRQESRGRLMAQSKGRQGNEKS
jgi:hypothetical protein